MTGIRIVTVGGNHVTQQARHAGVLLWAVAAIVWPLPGVHADVALQMRCTAESLVAILAFEGLGVTQHVLFQR